MTRILVAGGPRTGKTVLGAKLAAEHCVPLLCTDAVIGAGWSEASQIVSCWLDEPGDFVIEGVAVPRALRKWLARNPKGKPADVLYWLDVPKVEQTPGQLAMSKGCASVWAEIRHELQARGLRVL